MPDLEVATLKSTARPPCEPTVSSANAAARDDSFESFIEVSGLHKSYGRTRAVDGVSFCVKSGDIFGLLGPNGAGKSTIMMMLAGVLRPDAGRILIDGCPFESHDRRVRRQLGIVPQDLAIYPELSARENLRFFGGLYDVPRAQLNDRVELILNQTGLVDQADNRVSTFSGGMKRRLNLGVALVHQPRILILDEPTVGVDPQSRAHLLDWIGRLSQAGTAVIYASHYMEEVQAICDRAAIMDRGRIVATGTINELLQRVAGSTHLHVADFKPELASRVTAMSGVRLDVDGSEAYITMIRTANSDDAGSTSELTGLLRLLDEGGTRVRGIETREANLEQLFLELTGHRLRD